MEIKYIILLVIFFALAEWWFRIEKSDSSDYYRGFMSYIVWWIVFLVALGISIGLLI
jgi:hypothetical protein